nr:reverse transcriptase domain-containing protein [Tanacetum cinerariifolium]
MPSDSLKIIESKSKVRQSRAKAVIAKVNSNSSTPAISSDVAELKDMVRALLLDEKNQSSAQATSSTPAPIKAVESNCVTCGGTHSYQNCPATSGNVYQDNINEYVSQAAAANYNQGNTGFRPGTLPSNTVTNPKEDLKGITTRSEITYQGLTIPTTSSSLPEVVKRETEVTKDTPIVAPVAESVAFPVSAPKPSQKPPIPYPSRFQDQKLQDKTNDQKEKFFKIFQDLNFNISFADALILMPKFGPSIKSLLTNKDKLFVLARTQLNEHCSAVFLKKFPKKLGDPGKFLIPCDFPEMNECLALADLDASINLMPLSVWNKISLSELIPTLMTLKLADRSISRPIGVTKDVYVKVGKFYFSADFVVVDFDADPRVPLILRRSFLKTGRALIDVFEEELTLQYSQEVLGFSNVFVSGNPTPYYDPIVSTSSSTLTPFGDSDFLLKEVDAFLALEDDATLPDVDQSNYNSEGDILLLKTFLNDDPSLPPHTRGNYLP